MRPQALLPCEPNYCARKFWKKLSISVIGVKRKLRRLSSVGKRIYNSKFKDPSNPPSHREIYKSYGKRKLQDFYNPEAFDFSNPQTIYREHWQLYLDYAALHNMPKNQTGSRRYDTAVERRRAASNYVRSRGEPPIRASLKRWFSFKILALIVVSSLHYQRKTQFQPLTQFPNPSGEES